LALPHLLFTGPVMTARIVRPRLHAVHRLDQMPKSSLSVLALEAIDCALARSSALFFGVEKP
jgi:hypothetical protein